MAPAICPDCTLLVRPIFGEAIAANSGAPSATPEELGAAIIECVEAGAHVLNLSLALARPSTKREHALEEALGHAMRRGVIVVAAAGNQGTIGSSAITRHPWVIPVVACDLRGRPLGVSNLAGSIGRRGLGAPGDRITSLGPDGEVRTFSGTSFAVPFVTGAVALLWSAFPSSPAAKVRAAVTQSHRGRRTSVAPPLLDALAAYRAMAGGQAGG
jgi:subtilisin family serine protease